MIYSTGSHEDIKAIQRLMNMHDFYRALPDFYLGGLNREAIKKMRSGTYAPDLNKTGKHQDAFYTSLIIRLSDSKGASLFNRLDQVFYEIADLIKNSYPDTNPEVYFNSAHITIRSLVQKKEQNIEDLTTYRNILFPKLKKWVDCFSQDTIFFVKGLHVSLNSFKGLSIGVKIYPSTPFIQMLRGVAGEALYDAQDKGTLNPGDLWEESHCTTWHTKLTHATFLRERDPEFLPPWASAPIPEKEKAFIYAFEALVEKYENEVFGKISNIQLEDIFIRNGMSDKMLVGANGGVEISMAPPN